MNGASAKAWEGGGENREDWGAKVRGHHDVEPDVTVLRGAGSGTHLAGNRAKEAAT